MSFTLAGAHQCARNFEEAERYALKALAMGPEFIGVLVQLAELYVATDRFAEAVETWQKIYRIWDLEEQAVRLGERYETEGPHGYWQTLLETPDPYSPDTMYLAYLNGGLGDYDLAFEWLDKAMVQKNNGTSFLGVWPAWDVLREDPRFDDYVARLKRPPTPPN